MKQKLAEALWRLYRRPDKPDLWGMNAGNLPWHDPDFSRRMLAQHLDESHGAASRQSQEREMQIEWMWRKLGLNAGMSILDFTCGPGLYAVPFAGKGCHVTGIDFAPAAIEHAQVLAKASGVSEQSTFLQADVTQWEPTPNSFDAGIFIYGQMAVFPKETAKELLRKLAVALKPEAKLCLELLNPEHADKEDSSWWYTGDSGLWGDKPFLHLGERFWHEAVQTSSERFQIIHLETGEMEEIYLCDQLYAPQEIKNMLHQAGFADVMVYPAWEHSPLYDADEWLVYIARV